MDVLYVFAMVGLWAVAAAMVWGCDRLLASRS